MTKEQLLSLAERGRELDAEIQTLVAQFKGVTMAQVAKKLMPMMMSGNLSPEKMGLPIDIMEKLEEYSHINATLNKAVVHLLGGK